MKVLVVDDSRAMRSHLVRLLRGVGANCIEAADGLLALERVEHDGPFDVVLLDYNMPNLDGPGFLDRVSRMPEAYDMKTLMVTSMTDQSFIVNALRAGADDYLMKPFTKELLYEKLRLLDLDVPTA
ncbi:MAG TPA: response regulator [bacterium]|nr:response regulator [bacterium]